MKKVFTLLLFTTLSILFAFSQDFAEPIQGEGIHAFLRRNNRSESGYYQKFLELNRDKLGKDQSLKLGVSYQLPPLVKADSIVKPDSKTNTTQQTILGTGIEPLFGEKLAKYEIMSDRLKGACFFLVSGHGGLDPGAITKIGNIELHEDEYNYDVMLRLARNLLQEGATVHIIIRDSKDGIRDDKYLSNNKTTDPKDNQETCMGEKIHQGYDKKDVIKRLNQQCNKINALSKKSNAKYQRAVFIHWDSRPKNQSVDIFFNYSENNAKGKQLANTLEKTVREHYKKSQPNRPYKGLVVHPNYHVLRNTTPVSVLIELGNMQHEGKDRQRYLDSDNRQAIANWLCNGLIKDYNDNK